MTPERWQQVGEIFQAAVELDPDERAAFLVNLCADDEELRREVESLITADKEGLSIVDEPAVNVAAGLLVSSENELMEGQSIGRYEIVGPIGKGGMGEVYLAKDKLLNRRIALKLLPTDYSCDNERLQRFEREAQAASALNHPNILTIHEIGRGDNQQFIATEFVEGVTLRQRLKHGGLSLSEALDVATQIASALAAAHKAGIIHRDIKPENIMLRPDGYVKVLDFGLAKLTQEAERLPGPIDTAKPEISSGLVMGTVKYMSPEQARGLSTDLRSDIFSVGVVLYEMTTGHAPFKGTASNELVRSIIKDEPRPLTEYAVNAPAELQRIVSKTLNKNRTKRYQTSEDLLVDLKTLRQKLELKNGSRLVVRGEEPGDVSTGDIEVETASTSEYLVSQIKQHKAGATVGVLTLVALILGFTYPLKKFLGKQSVSRDKLNVTRLTTTGSGVGGGSIYLFAPVAISPDGTSIAYVGNSQGSQSLSIRPVSADRGVELWKPKTPGAFFAASFSPDGSQIFYLWSENGGSLGDIYRIPVAGGWPELVTKDIQYSFTISPDGKRIAYYRLGHSTDNTNTLFVANIDGSDERELSSCGPSVQYGYLAWSPDGRTIAYSRVSIAGAVRSKLVSIRVEDGKEQPISPMTWENITGQIAWLSDGSALLVIGRDENSAFSQIWLVDYLSGDTRRITNDLNNYRYLSLTANSKTLVTVSTEQVSRIWVARNGDTRQAQQITSGKYDGVGGLTWTADRRIVFVSAASGNEDIWVMNDDGSHPTQLTSDPHKDLLPSVSPDNRYIFFLSYRAGTSNIWRMNIDGSSPRQLTHGSNDFYPEVSPDGQWVVYASRSFTSNKAVLWRVPIDGGNPIQLTEGFIANVPTISPDGKLIASVARKLNEPSKIAIIPFEGGEPVKTLDGGSVYFRWAPDARSLTFNVIRNGVSNLITQSLDTNETRAETDFKSDLIFGFDWSRDRSLVYSQGVKTSDIVLISDFR